MMNVFGWISRKVTDAIFAGVRDAFKELDETPRDEMLAKLGIHQAEQIEDQSMTDVVENGNGRRKRTTVK